MIKYVVSLEESKLLAPLLPEGFESELKWVRRRRNKYNTWQAWTVTRNIIKIEDSLTYQSYPALLLDEVLGLLPHNINAGNKIGAFFEMTKTYVGYRSAGKAIKVFFFTKTDNPATAASKLYRQGKENGYIND